MKTSKIKVQYLDQPFILTTRSMECLILASLGFPKKHIASRLGISYRTTEKHIATAKAKMGIHNHRQLLDFLFSSKMLMLTRAEAPSTPQPSSAKSTVTLDTPTSTTTTSTTLTSYDNHKFSK